MPRAHGSHGSAKDTFELDEKVAELKFRGLPHAQIASALNISRQTVQVALARFKEHNVTLRTADPLKIVDEMITGYQADLSELAVISNATTNVNARVGAINSRMAARDRIIALLQATGVLPHDLSQLRMAADARFVADRIVQVMEKYEVPEEAQDEIIDLLGGDPDVIEGHATSS